MKVTPHHQQKSIQARGNESQARGKTLQRLQKVLQAREKESQAKEKELQRIEEKILANDIRRQIELEKQIYRTKANMNATAKSARIERTVKRAKNLEEKGFNIKEAINKAKEEEDREQLNHQRLLNNFRETKKFEKRIKNAKEPVVSINEYGDSKPYFSWANAENDNGMYNSTLIWKQQIPKKNPKIGGRSKKKIKKMQQLKSSIGKKKNIK